MRVYGRHHLTWQEFDGCWALCCQGKRGTLLHVVPDAVYPGMWRIKRPDGSLSDLVNLTRAKDGAIAVALGILNHCDAQRAA